MALKEEFASLTPEQREAFARIKNAKQLEAFIDDSELELSGEEKMTLLDHLESGKLPLSDDDIESAAGGLSFPYPPQRDKSV